MQEVTGEILKINDGSKPNPDYEWFLMSFNAGIWLST